MTHHYIDHAVALGPDGEWTDFNPTDEQCRYQNRRRYGEIRSLISDDVTEYHVAPLFRSDELLAVGVSYDGVRLHHELFHHVARMVFNDGTIKNIFVALIDPVDGGAHGLVVSFKEAYGRLFSKVKLKTSMFCMFTLQTYLCYSTYLDFGF